MQTGYAASSMKMLENKGLSLVEAEMEKLMHRTSRSCSGRGKDGTGTTTKAGGLTRSCVPRQHVKRWSTSVDTRCT